MLGTNCVGAPHHLQPPKQPNVPFSDAQDAARLLLEGPQRYTCLAGGTRSGKTFLIVRAIVQRAIHAPGSHHAILRFHNNAAWASLAQETLPRVMKLCFPHVYLKEHRHDGFFTMHNESRIIVGGLDDDERVEKILGHEYASVNGTAQDGWSLTTPNTLTFAAPPAAGAAIAADFAYAFLCRFLDDQEDFENVMSGLWQVSSLKFRRVRA